MNTLYGTLKCSSKDRFSIQILTDSGEFDFWKKVEPTFWSLCGNNVIYEKDTLSCSLSFEATNWVFHYESKKNMFLKKSGDGECLDVAAHLASLFLLLHNQKVIIEADKEHFKICADTRTHK
jgi:hypothetical protein